MSTITILNEEQIRIIVNDAVRGALKDTLEDVLSVEEHKKKGYITRKRVCELLHISTPTVYAWIKQGKLKSYRIGGRTLFKENEVLEAVKPLDYNLERKGGNKLW